MLIYCKNNIFVTAIKTKTFKNMKKFPPLSTEHAKEFYEGATMFTNPRIRRIPRFDYQNLPTPSD